MGKKLQGPYRIVQNTSKIIDSLRKLIVDFQPLFSLEGLDVSEVVKFGL